ncbi:MAG: 50S ribosomal protein L17 [Bacteroidetes bacterium]|nr:50S ribosomal protein L17 [Rhodothermia bacterium]MCS7154572.1 50S ribosomal protein L17 [Bacteroidota bacterium]MCX7906289.1 50S ribosomal protein L17 [Bacteroidota bacterium]MDW8137365.1 50S ribosomal protein L17 [Bacteroidota bacterium]MDW8285681.1 50S ribosomal protein L17 [Bacteroidota bacterium]
MRHGVKGRKLGRTAEHRRATLAALSRALIQHKRIITTLAKAKELRRVIEPIITRAKLDSTHNRRIAFAFLQDKRAIQELFGSVAPKAKERPGGYTRVVRLGRRQGDGAEMAVIELVDFNDVKPTQPGTRRKRTRRGGGKSRSGGAGKPPEAASPTGSSSPSEPVQPEA